MENVTNTPASLNGREQSRFLECRDSLLNLSILSGLLRLDIDKEYQQILDRYCEMCRLDTFNIVILLLDLIIRFSALKAYATQLQQELLQNIDVRQQGLDQHLDECQDQANQHFNEQRQRWDQQVREGHQELDRHLAERQQELDRHLDKRQQDLDQHLEERQDQANQHFNEEVESALVAINDKKNEVIDTVEEAAKSLDKMRTKAHEEEARCEENAKRRARDAAEQAEEHAKLVAFCKNSVSGKVMVRLG